MIENWTNIVKLNLPKFSKGLFHNWTLDTKDIPQKFQMSLHLILIIKNNENGRFQNVY